MDFRKLLTKLTNTSDPLYFLYLSNVIAMGLSVLTTYAWGHWVSSADLNFIQFVIRYGAMLGFIAFPGMNEAANLAAGRGQYRTALVALLLRFLGYFTAIIVVFAVSHFSGRSLFPGIPADALPYLLWYAPAILLPAYAMGVFLSLNKHQWTAGVRVLTALAPLVFLGVLYFSGAMTGVGGQYIILMGAAHLLLILPMFILLNRDNTGSSRENNLISYGLQGSAIRWPEFALSFEIVVLAAFLSPLELTLFFLADRVCDHAKSFLSNNFSDAFARYSRLPDSRAVLAASIDDFWRWLKRSPLYALGLLLIIPAGMILWRRDYWAAIPICMTLVFLVLAGTPSTFIRQGLIATQQKFYMSLHTVLVSLSYLTTLIVLAPQLGVWGVVAARAVLVLFGSFLAIYFCFWRPGTMYNRNHVDRETHS